MTLENINNQVKNLVYNLLNNGDRYITHCDNYSICYTINNKKTSITVRHGNFENKEYKLHVPNVEFLEWRIVNPAFDRIELPLCLEISIDGHCYYYYPENRIEEASLLDLMEQTAGNYLWNNLTAVNNNLFQENEDI